MGCVPQDPQVMQAVMQQVPVSIQNPGAKASQAYQEDRRENVRKRRRYSAGAAAQARNGGIFFSHYRYEKWSYKTVQIREV